MGNYMKNVPLKEDWHIITLRAFTLADLTGLLLYLLLHLSPFVFENLYGTLCY